MNSRLFLHSVCSIQSDVVNFQPFLTSSGIFHAFTNFLKQNDPEIEKHYKWTLKRLKVGMVSSLHPHSMCKRVERVTSKTGCTSCTKRTISFEVSGFHTETRLLQRDSFFKTYLNSWLFVCSKCTIQSHIIIFLILSDFICYFSCIY